MKVAIYGQYYQESTRPIIRDILSFFNERKIEMIIEESFLAKIYEKELASRPYKTFVSHKDLDSTFDLFISIGGDGTILRAATLVRDSGIPVLGINAGRLGFLATVQKDNIHEFLQFIIEGKYTTSERTLLSVTCDPEIESIGELNFAMNDITVNRKDTTSMITIETFLNGSYYWADGLIISTPTGSTGYSLSCGGPVLTPDVSSLVLTPIAPHNLSTRPLVIPDCTEIRLRVTGREDQFLVSLDSRTFSVLNESVLTITKTPFKINMVEIPEESFLKRLRTKLLWGEDKRN